MPPRVIGIDLGTTNSVVSVVEGGRAIVLPDTGGARIQPSIVSFTPHGEILVGHKAKDRLTVDPANTVYSVKRFIGRNFYSREVKLAAESHTFAIVPDESGNPVIVGHDKHYAIPEISGFVLGHMKSIAFPELDRTEHVKAVVTVPANFSDAQRQSTKLAGQIAGLDVIRILNEPTAAALAYGFGKGMNATLAVYDFGGGTFDVSILRVRDNVFEVLATAGDSYLGGDDFDYRIVNNMITTLYRNKGVRTSRDAVAMWRLKAVAERIKVQLTQQARVEAEIQELLVGAEGPVDLRYVLDRRSFNEQCRDIVQKTFAVCDRALADSGLTVDDVDHLILVGGSSRVPLVRQMVEQYFQAEIASDINADEVVARGAAIQGATQALDDLDASHWRTEESTLELESPLLASGADAKAELATLALAKKERRPRSQPDRPVLFDVTPQSLGLATVGGYCDVLIPRNTTVPVEHTRHFTTSVDGQSSVKVRVIQGESRLSSQNLKLGELELYGLRSAQRGEVIVEVTFAIDTDGIVHVTATDQETGVEQSVRLQLHAGFSKAEETRMIQRHRRKEAN